MEPVTAGGFLGFELGADGGGGIHLCYPGSGSRHFDDPNSILKMNGREVFKFATRVMVSSAEARSPVALAPAARDAPMSPADCSMD